MKNIVSSLLIMATVGLLWSCDTSEEFIQNRNETPQFTISIGNAVDVFISDSLKSSDNNNVFIKEVWLYYSDANSNIEEITISSPTNDVFIIEEDTLLIDNYVKLVSPGQDSIKLELICFEPGFKQLTFKGTDSFLQTAEVELEMYVFENIIPVVNFTYDIDETNQIIEFNLNESFDQDSNYGGYLTQYELIFNGETSTRTIPEFTVVYSDSQSIYDFSVRVQDNNGDFSNTKTDRIRL